MSGELPQRPCPYGICDGGGIVTDLEANTTYRCRCWPEQVARRRAGKLSRERAAEDYALAFNPAGGIDEAATATLRAGRRT